MRLPVVPASFFGIVLGLAGLGNGWRVAARVWGVPAAVGESILFLAALVWALLVVLYAAKWLWAQTRTEALAEARHPVQCCFIGLVGVATMLVAGAALPHSHILGVSLYALGAIYTVAFGVWRTGLLWQGERDPGTTTAVLYLPTVAGSFVAAAGAAALGHRELGQMAFGAGLFSWLAIESVLLHRLYTAPALPPPLRPTLGVQLAPPVVGAVAYLAVTGGPTDVAAHALVGYGTLQALLMLRLLPWIAQQSFTAGYWGFSFGATALGTAFLRLVERGDGGAIALAAPYLFATVNGAMLVLVVGTLRLLVQGRLLPPPASVPAPAAKA